MEIPAIIFRNPNNTQILASEQDTYAHNTLQKVIINGWKDNMQKIKQSHSISRE